VSTYQYYEFLAIDRPLDERQQAEVRTLSTRARITATSFTNEYHWGDFRGDPRTMVERYYDAHLYLADWGAHQVMLRMPRTILDVKTVEPYCADPHATAWTTGEHLILDLTSQDESGDWVEGAADSLSALSSRGARRRGPAAPLPGLAGRLRNLGTRRWRLRRRRKTNANRRCPPAWARSPRRNAPWRTSCAWTPTCSRSRPSRAHRWPSPRTIPENWPSGSRICLPGIRRCSSSRSLKVTAPGFRWSSSGASAVPPAVGDDGRPRRTVAQLLDAAADIKLERQRQAEAARAAEEARRAGQCALAREKRLDALARDEETAWVRVESLIDTRKQDHYDAAVELLDDLQEVTARLAEGCRRRWRRSPPALRRRLCRHRCGRAG
jgi:hypothetical protein